MNTKLTTEDLAALRRLVEAVWEWADGPACDCELRDGERALVNAWHIVKARDILDRLQPDEAPAYTGPERRVWPCTVHGSKVLIEDRRAK